MADPCAISWCGALATVGRYCAVHHHELVYRPGRTVAKPSRKRRGLPKKPHEPRLFFETKVDGDG
jgi:hypothetical protein